MKKYIFLSILISTFIIGCKQKKNESPAASTLFTVRDYTDSVFTTGIEGPATKEGFLYAVSFEKDGTIGKIDKDGKAELFVTLPQGSTGNGIRFDSKGDMLVADYSGHNLLKVDMNTKAISVYAHETSMNQPNDLAMMKNGLVFCSDPNWGNNTGNLWMADREGKFHLLEANMGTTNGVEVGTGDTVLYVNESIQRNVWAYTLSSDGAISNKRLFMHFNENGLDGMRCDKEGNVYITRYDNGTVAVVSPHGKLIREIKLKGKKPTNITFGGPDGKTCYVTLQDRGVIETFQNDIAGRE